MAKVTWDVAAAFAVQVAEGDYEDNLDTISATLQGDPDNTDDGLVLGDAESGEGGSGLSLTLGRTNRPKAVVGASFTRDISDFLRLDVPTFSFSWPFCGNRADTHATTVADADFQPSVGVDGILEAAGLAGTTWDGGIGYTYEPGGTNLMSALIYYYGNRLELLDCRVSSMSVNYTPGSIAIATAEIAVGSVKDPADNTATTQALPDLTYGPQSSVSAPVIESINNVWSQDRGFSSLTLTVNNTIEEIPDSNAVAGRVFEISAQEFLIDATLFVDDDGDDEVFALNQALATANGDLSEFSFTVGTAQTSTSSPATAHKISLLDPELITTGPTKLGTKAGNVISLVGRSATANSEFDLTFI
jgi:hypothetical protein